MNKSLQNAGAAAHGRLLFAGVLSAAVFLTLVLAGCGKKQFRGNDSKPPAAAKLLESMTTKSDGDVTAVKFEYDDKDRIVKIYSYSGGKLTEAETFTYYGDDLVEITYYAGQEAEKAREISFRRKGNKIYTSGTDYTEIIMNEDGSLVANNTGTITLNEDGYIIRRETSYPDYSDTVNYQYQDGNLIYVSSIATGADGHPYGDPTASSYKYDDKKTPFYHCKTPKWALQLRSIGNKNNITVSGFEADNTWGNIAINVYEYDRDEFPTKRTGAIRNEQPLGITTFTYRGEAGQTQGRQAESRVKHHYANAVLDVVFYEDGTVAGNIWSGEKKCHYEESENCLQIVSPDCESGDDSCLCESDVGFCLFDEENLIRKEWKTVNFHEVKSPYQVTNFIAKEDIQHIDKSCMVFLMPKELEDGDNWNDSFNAGEPPNADAPSFRESLDEMQKKWGIDYVISNKKYLSFAVNSPSSEKGKEGGESNILVDAKETRGSGRFEHFPVILYKKGQIPRHLCGNVFGDNDNIGGYTEILDYLELKPSFDSKVRPGEKVQFGKIYVDTFVYHRVTNDICGHADCKRSAMILEKNGEIHYMESNVEHYINARERDLLEIKWKLGVNYWEPSDYIYFSPGYWLYAESVKKVGKHIYKTGNIGPGGGLIFYDKGNKSDGWRFLEAAPEGEEFEAEWGISSDDFAGTGTGIGTGEKNTELIAKFMGSQKVGETAAQQCANLRSLSYVINYEDWFLPSKDELDLMYKNLKKAGLGGFQDGFYWTSSQSGGNSAWGQNFSDGSQSGNAKNRKFWVRAVRAF